jgi:hypothetical protein
MGVDFPVFTEVFKCFMTIGVLLRFPDFVVELCSGILRMVFRSWV